jgi:hypothetical protein
MQVLRKGLRHSVIEANVAELTLRQRHQFRQQLLCAFIRHYGVDR